MQVLERITSAFRGRTMTLAQMQAKTSNTSVNTSVNRWAIYKQLCIAKTQFGVNDRCLAVLSSLLSFYPNNEISHKTGLVVFPSNRQLALRAHGMPESTLRRHLAALVKAGLILRRDSPNGKRYAYKDRAGEVEEAFGFSVLPLLERADEIAQAAQSIQAEALALKRTREKITLLRREIAQLILAAETEGNSSSIQPENDHFQALIKELPRRATSLELTQNLENLSALHAQLSISLNFQDNTKEMSTSDAQNERHYKESLTESSFESSLCNLVDLKPPFVPKLSSALEPIQHQTSRAFSLDMVLRACPDIREYAAQGIACWRDLVDTTRGVASFLGISDSAYQDATSIVGRERISALIAWILQRGGEIKSPGGYLRSLTAKIRAGETDVAKLLFGNLENENRQFLCSSRAMIEPRNEAVHS
ncbi:replication initiation protein [Ochrobactrum sp. MYb29]|uniref:plasmid replication protein RepC n=1 Tax=Brucella pituitosa TaxID=571256 RepID=UPI000C27A08A|nr:plasmid replication protein RepC [Brucella pituitosa]PJO48071.1 replication initiation protein [Brucella pituitosa]PRA78603.1 replication initiation protein [Ochrobactrum sp. MYb29]